MPRRWTATKLFVPPYPPRPDRPRASFSTLLTLQRNPIEVWCEADFEGPVSVGRTVFGLRGPTHDPAAVRRIFLDNAANYRKDDLQLRILRPGLGSGLLMAEDEHWRVQRTLG
jgi:cytochrome P450